MDNSIPVSSAPQSTKRTFTAAETVFAWLSLALGYLFCRAFPATSHPMGAFLFIVLITAVTAVVLALNKAPFGAVSVCSAVSSVVFAFSLTLTENGFIHFFAYLYCVAAYCLFVYTACGNHEKSTFAHLFPLDYFLCLFVAPFQSLSEIGRALLANGRINAKPLLKAILGIVLAVVPTAVIMVLLSYDSDFTDLVNRIFDFDLNNIASHVGSLIFGIPVGMYIYGLFISSNDKKCKNMIPEDKLKKTLLTVKILPAITSVCAVLPILFIYVLFFISQWKYYISGFVGVLPDEQSYASYAREGFFQLCTVAVINFMIIGVLGLFMHRKNEKPSVTQKILSILFSLSTLILIATALAKMAMYIDIYGLTPKRVYATWFMLVLAVIFILVLVKQLARRFPLIFIAALAVVLLFAALVFIQPDRFIADYNADRYIDGTLEKVDVTAMRSLGYSAVPAMVKIVKYWDEQNGTSFEEYYKSPSKLSYADSDYRYLCNILENMANRKKNDIWSYTFVRDRAVKAFKEIGLPLPEKDS